MNPQVSSAQNEPVLDEATFQLLLAAAYTLQEHPDRPCASLMPSPCPQPMNCFPKPAELPYSRALRPASFESSRAWRGDKLFWRVAAVFAVAAISALLLGSSIHRFSPFPERLFVPEEAVQRPVPFHKATVARRPRAILPTTTEPAKLPGSTNAPIPRASGANNANPEDTAGPALAPKKTVQPGAPVAPYTSEADVVAADTVVRYSGGPALPRAQLRKP